MTPREAEILDSLVKGLSNAEIGVALGIAVHTVKGHLSRLAAKLLVDSKPINSRILLASYWECPLFRLGCQQD